MSSDSADPASPPAPVPINALTNRFPESNLTVLSHFYRGELSRSIAWRHKMDLITHWAILTTSAMISVCFTSPVGGHIILPFAALMLFMLLNVEGRRYRYFDVWRTRVRMLEVHLMVPAVAHHGPIREGNWREMLCRDLMVPAYKISYWEAVGRRLGRNYVWLFLLLLLAWAVKIYLDGNPGDTFVESARLLNRQKEEVVSGWLVISVVSAFYFGLAGLVFYAHKVRDATGEIRRRDPNQKLWPI